MDTAIDLTSPAVPRTKAGLPAHQNALLATFAGLFVLVLLGPFMSYSALPGTGEGSVLRQAGYASAFLATLIALRPWVDPRRVLVVPLFILITLAWCWISVSWALVPDVSLRRITLTTIIIWTIFALITQLGYDRPVAIMRVLLLALMIINIAVSVLLPDFGIHHVNEPGDRNLIGDWRGIMTHKNFAGPPAVILIYLFVFDAKRIPIILRAAVVLVACYFLYRCGSKTSVGIGLFALVAGLLYQFASGVYRPILIVSAFIVGIAVTVMGFVYKYPLAGNFTDPNAFTGRPLIWKALVDYWQQHPWTGSGIGSFWNIGSQSPIYHYATGWVTEVTIGHNGFLDLLAQVGIPGLVLALWSALIVPLFWLLSRKEDHSPSGALIVAMILFCVGHNSTETSLFDRDAMPQVFLMIAIAFITLRLTGSRQRAPALFRRKA